MGKTFHSTIDVPNMAKEAFENDDKYFPTALQKFQFYSKYSRFNAEQGRRETWVETVDRAVNYLRELSEDKLSNATYNRIRKSILQMDVMPSMRLMAMAGPAAQRSNITIYNCSYIPVDSLDAFVEALIISMSGCGVGFSVESKYVDQLPTHPVKNGISVPMGYYDRIIEPYVVDDSADGWAEALRLGLETWFAGKDISFDYSRLRPEGTPLKTKGGRSSGPEPLREMLDFIRHIILNGSTPKLSTTDAHRIMCKVGDAAVSGGMRRTAMISLFDKDDQDMLHIKDHITKETKYLSNANNSAVWEDEVSQAELLDQFNTMVAAGSGEPGIFNRQGISNTRPERRQDVVFGSNPCGEIALRPNSFCNLTDVVCRSWDTLESLKEKVAIATIIGTIQSMATNFPGLRPIWKQNAEEERLLGVGLSGQMDCKAVQDADVMRELRSVAINVNLAMAKKLKINQSAAITCVKPSGNSSLLVNCAPGLHLRPAKYYMRRVRISRTDPVYYVLEANGVELLPDGVTDDVDPETAMTWVASFPMRSPDGAITRKDVSAVEQCDYWLKNKVNWTEHNPSVTINYKPSEVLDLLQWIWHNRDRIGGMSFLPQSDIKYRLAPEEEISQEEYEKQIEKFPYIDFSTIMDFEHSDLTNAAQEVACVSGLCTV